MIKKIGTINKHIIAASRPESTLISPPIVLAIAGGIVLVNLLVSNSENKNSFQVNINAKTDVADSQSFTCGIQTPKKTDFSEAPSILDASSISVFNSSKKLFIIQIEKGRLNAVYISIIPV